MSGLGLTQSSKSGSYNAPAKRRGWILLAFAFCVGVALTLVLPRPAQAASAQFSSRDQAALLHALTRAVPGRFPLLEKAQRAYLRGDERAARLALKSFIDSNPRLAVALSREARAGRAAVDRRSLLNHLAVTRRDLLEKRSRAIVTQLQSVIWEVARQEMAGRDFIAGNLSPARNAALARAVDRVQDELGRLRSGFDGARAETLVSFQLRNSGLLVQVTHFLEALLNRHSTVEERADTLADSIARFRARGGFPIDGARLRALGNREAREDKVRIWVNRDTVTAVGFAAALVAEVATIPFSGGASAAAMPATLLAIRTGANWSTRGLWITLGSLSIADRLKKNGTGAFRDVGLYLDALLIATCLPAPVRASMAPTSFYQRFVKLQAKGDYAFIFSAGLMNVWAFYNAEHLARESNLSATEIRQQSALRTAAYLFYGIKWSRYPYTPPAVR